MGWTRAQHPCLARFLQATSFSRAAVLNLANVSRETQVSRKTVEGTSEFSKISCWHSGKYPRANGEAP
jgi:hypothetical protein